MQLLDPAYIASVRESLNEGADFSAFLEPEAIGTYREALASMAQSVDELLAQRAATYGTEMGKASETLQDYETWKHRTNHFKRVLQRRLSLVNRAIKEHNREKDRNRKTLKGAVATHMEELTAEGRGHIEHPADVKLWRAAGLIPEVIDGEVQLTDVEPVFVPGMTAPDIQGRDVLPQARLGDPQE